MWPTKLDQPLETGLFVELVMVASHALALRLVGFEGSLRSDSNGDVYRHAGDPTPSRVPERPVVPARAARRREHDFAFSDRESRRRKANPWGVIPREQTASAAPIRGRQRLSKRWLQ